MKHISELLTDLTAILENQVRTRITNNMPDTPIAIIYAGEKALEAKADLQNTLQGVWRARTDGICQVVWNSREGYGIPEKDGSIQPLTEDGLQEKIDEMFAQEQSFRTMNGLLLCLVQNSADYTELEEFQTGYKMLNDLQQKLGMASCNTLKIVMLDDSGKGRTLAQAIRGDLSKRLAEKDPTCQSTVILSNRLKNGVLLAGERIRENYALAANLIILANGSNGPMGPRLHQMFPVTKPSYLTASYSRIQKPNRKICEIMVNAMLTWLEKRFSTGELLLTDALSQRLEINAGSMKFIENCFKQNVFEILPKRETLEYLPRNSADLGTIGDKIFAEYNRITMGSFELFYENTFRSVCSSESIKRLFRESFAEEVRQKITPCEAARSITSQTVSQLLGQLRYETPSDRLPAFQYMLTKVKADFCQQMCPICEEVLLEYGNESKNHIQQITEVVQEFQNAYMLDVDETLRQYYHNFVWDKLNSDTGEMLLRAFNQTGLTKEKMFDALYDTLSLLFTSNEIFSMTLEDELTERMGGNGKQVQQIIQEELTNGLTDRVRLQTVIVPEILFETILVNQKNNGIDGTLYQHLSTIFPNASCLDTGNSNTIEFVQLYTIDDHVI